MDQAEPKKTGRPAKAPGEKMIPVPVRLTPGQRDKLQRIGVQRMRDWLDLYDAADALERTPRWRDVAEELPQEAQEVLFVRGGKTVHGAWIGGIFWHSNQKMAAAKWMPLPLPPNAAITGAGTASAGMTGSAAAGTKKGY